MREQTISMKDVAALAGVSVGTVSNMVNSPDRVSDVTRERVRAAIDKLGWVRNDSARQLRTGHSSSIGLVVLDVENPFFAGVIRGAEDVAYSHGYSVHVGNSAASEAREDTLLRQFEQQRAAGVLLAPIGEAADRVRRLRARGVQAVLVDRAGDSADACSVAADDLEGGRLAAQHVVDMGHRRIGFVGGSSGLAQVRDRMRGAELVLRSAHGLPTLLAISTPALDVASGVAAASEIALMQDLYRPTAVICANDLLAIGVLQGLVRANLRVPDDVAVVGYDDIAFAAWAAVPISSVRQPNREIGARAAELLFEEIGAAAASVPHRHVDVRFQPELVVRRSSAFRRPGRLPTDPEFGISIQQGAAQPYGR